MTTTDVTRLADATQKVLAGLGNELTIDSFLEQTLHAGEHGVGLTELGRLILDERIDMKLHN